MLRSTHSLRKGVLLIMLIIIASMWLVTAMPALAQSEETTPEPSMLERFFEQPDLVAPLAVPMVLALGGIVTLMAFLAWVFSRLPQNS